MSAVVKRLLFAVAAVVVTIALMICAFFAADVYLHRRAERSAGLNLWGYRGPAVGRKGAGTVRVVVLGGSTAFGYGVIWNEAFPAQLEQQLNASAPTHFEVVNLGYNSEGAYSFAFTLADYAYLRADVVVLYEGYNDLAAELGQNRAVYRHQSPLFRITGYYPMLPLVLREKAMAMRFGGNLNAAYGAAAEKTVFRVPLSVRATSGALDAAADLGEVLERQLARMSEAKTPAEVKVAVPSSESALCAAPWGTYCASVAAAIDQARRAGQRVVFVRQPRLVHPVGSGLQVQQQSAVHAMLRSRYAGARDVMYADLSDAVDLTDSATTFDGMHLTVSGNGRIAARLVRPILDVVAERGAVSAGPRAGEAESR